jgi:hypothetical protein
MMPERELEKPDFKSDVYPMKSLNFCPIGNYEPERKTMFGRSFENLST